MITDMISNKKLNQIVMNYLLGEENQTFLFFLSHKLILLL